MAKPVDKRKDINTANSIQLAEAPMINTQRAKAIIDYRTRHGNYRDMEDLLKVPSIRETMLESLQAHFKIYDETRGKEKDPNDSSKPYEAPEQPQVEQQ